MLKKGFFMAAILAVPGLAWHIWTNAASARNLPVDTVRENTDEDGRRMGIRLSFGGQEAMAIPDNHPASRDFLSLLPLTLTFEDDNGTENRLFAQKAEYSGFSLRCKPSAGTFAYYAPWGNPAVFHHSFRQSNGLISLAQPVSGMEKLAGMHGNFSVRIEKAE